MQDAAHQMLVLDAGLPTQFAQFVAAVNRQGQNVADVGTRSARRALAKKAPTPVEQRLFRSEAEE